MCIMAVAVGSHEDFPFVLAHNRDEFFARTATEVLQDDDGVVAAVDSQSGGTWMGLAASTGVVAALTNVRCGRAPEPIGTRSRGELVSRVLRGDVAALASSDFAAFNLLHGRLQADGAPPTLSLSVSSPASPTPWQTRTSPVLEPGVGAVLSKSNDHGGAMTAAADGEALARQRGPVRQGCTWPKAAWLRAEVERTLGGEELAAARGEAGARALLAALEPHLSAASMPARFGELAEGVEPSEWSSLNSNDERALHRAPFIAPTEMPVDGAGRGAYGTVSQSVLIQSKAERAVYYAHRQTVPSGTGPPGSPAAPGAWSWRKVDLPASFVRTGALLGH